MAAFEPDTSTQISTRADPRASGVGFTEALRRAFTNWSIHRRASRSEFWWYVLAWVGSSWLLGPLSRVTHTRLVEQICLLVEITLWLICLKVAACRFHDIGRSAWWLVLQVILGLVGSAMFIFGTFLGVAYLLTSGANHGLVRAGVVGVLVGVVLLVPTLIWSLVWLVLPGNAAVNRWNGEAP